MLVPAWREAEGFFDRREQAALAWAETVTKVAKTKVPDEDYMGAAEIFSKKELVDLTIAIGLMSALNRMAISFRRKPKGVEE